MNFKKFGYFIIFLGCLITTYGLVQLSINRPKEFDRTESKTTIFGGKDDIGNWLNTESTNWDREQNRKKAVKFIIVGGIVFLIGGGIKYSASETINSPQNTNTKHIIYCSECGKQHAALSTDQFCDQCGSKL